MSRTKPGKRKGDDRVVLLKDLAPRKDVKGGAGRLLFGEQGQPPVAEDAPDGATRREENRRREKRST